MSFNTELEHEKLFNTVKDIYTYFENWQEYNPYVCDPKNLETIKELSKDISKKLESVIQDLDKLHDINIESYGC